MVQGDPMTISNTTGMARTTMNESVAGYSAVAAENGARITNPQTNPITPGRVNQSQDSQKTQSYHEGADKLSALARAFGMNIKATLSFGEGIDPSFGNHVLGPVTRDIHHDDGSVESIYITRGEKLNFAC